MVRQAIASTKSRPWHRRRPLEAALFLSADYEVGPVLWHSMKNGKRRRGFDRMVRHSDPACVALSSRSFTLTSDPERDGLSIV